MNDFFEKNKKLIAGFLIYLGAFLVLAALFTAATAKANFFDDLIKSLTAPFSSSGSTEKISPLPQVTLYKPVIDYEAAVVAAVKRASPAVVSITISKNVPIIENCPTDPLGNLPPDIRQFFGNDFPGFSVPCEKGTKFQEVGGGSGFIISENGLILTNKHVVVDAAASYTVLTNDGKKYDAKVLARDPAQDLAVLKIEATGLPTVTLGDSSSIELGQTAIAIGNALGEFRNTVSVGVISGLSRTVSASGGGVSETIQGVIQTDAAINPGNSGGPLLNLKGEVIGINTAVAEGAQNIGFTIPINRAKRDIDSVKSTGAIVTPYLGVRYIMVTPDLAKSGKLPFDYGALIKGGSDGPAVAPGSPADKAGLKSGDIILELNGEKLDLNNTIGDAIGNLSVGDSVNLKIRRGTNEISVTATLAKRPQ